MINEQRQDFKSTVWQIRVKERKDRPGVVASSEKVISWKKISVKIAGQKISVEIAGKRIQIFDETSFVRTANAWNDQCLQKQRF